MGFKGKQNLTSSGYKERHKKKHSIVSLISVESKLYKQSKRMYDKLCEKYNSAKEKTAIDSIMGRMSINTRISSKENRQLALLDIDKMISLATGTIKTNDVRFSVMMLVSETGENSERSRLNNRWQNNTIRNYLNEERNGWERELERLRQRRQRRREQRQRILDDMQNPIFRMPNHPLMTFERTENLFNLFQTILPNDPPTNLPHFLDDAFMMTPATNNPLPINNSPQETIERTNMILTPLRNNYNLLNNTFQIRQERTNIFQERTQRIPFGMVRQVMDGRVHDRQTVNEITDGTRGRPFIQGLPIFPIIRPNTTVNNQHPQTNQQNQNNLDESGFARLEHLDNLP